MPTLRLPVFGSRVVTQGRVMKRPASCGQHCRMGKSRREKLSCLITSLQGPVATVLGKNFPASVRSGSIFSLSRKPWGDFMSRNILMRSANSSNELTPRASFMRASEPNWLIRSWELGWPFMFWKSRAGPPGLPVFDLLTRLVISVISRIGSASVLMRFSSPARSRAAIHWRRSSKGKGFSREVMIINSCQGAGVRGWEDQHQNQNLYHGGHGVSQGKPYSLARSMVITSSEVTTPTSLRCSSITGRVTRLYLSKSSATSLSLVSFWVKISGS